MEAGFIRFSAFATLAPNKWLAFGFEAVPKKGLGAATDGPAPENGLGAASDGPAPTNRLPLGLHPMVCRRTNRLPLGLHPMVCRRTNCLTLATKAP